MKLKARFRFLYIEINGVCIDFLQAVEKAKDATQRAMEALKHPLSGSDLGDQGRDRNRVIRVGMRISLSCPAFLLCFVFRLGWS